MGVKKHLAILSYLSDKYGDILQKFSNKTTESESDIDPASPIWICWWQGEDNMPELVKVCYETIKKHAGSHPVKFIAESNYRKYAAFPDYIIEKVQKKIITVTHFSNMLRANLLYEYGGIWMDATILTLKDISFDNMPFFTLKAPAKKNNGVSMARFAGISGIAAPFRHDKNSPAVSRWSGFLLAGTKGSCIFEYMREILYAYWKDHKDQIDYVLYDYTIALGYDNIPEMKKLIDNVPCSIMEKFVLEINMDVEYSQENISKYLSVPFHKLTWKKSFNKFAKDGKLTIYGHLLENRDL